MLYFLFAGLELANKEGKDFGSAQIKKGFKAGDDLKGHGILDGPADDTPSTTVNKDARNIMDAVGSNKGEGLSGNRQVDMMLAQGDAIVNNPDKPLVIRQITPAATDKIFECVDYETMPQAYFHRTLHLNIKHTPYQARVTRVDKKTYKVCVKRTKHCTSLLGGHADDSPRCHTYRWLAEGPERTIETYQDCEKVCGWRYYREYTKDIETTVEVSPERPEKTEFIDEKWAVDDPNGLFPLVKNNDANLSKTECVEGAATRYFYGQPFFRNCWRQRVTVAYKGVGANNCMECRKQGCALISDQCIQYGPAGQCEAWKKHYRCAAEKQSTIQSGHNAIHCIDGGSLTGKPTKYDDMASSMAQLAAVSEMQKDLKSLNALSDPKNVHVFKGECNKCTKNIWDAVIYDCCGSLEGFAVNLGFTQCNAEERRLEQIRSEKRCQYVGQYANNFIAWKGSDTHVYCCYPSKLIAVLQKEARKQLGLDFGSPENPDCGGLSVDEIMRLDFSKMDLSELFDDILNKANTNQPTCDLEAAKEKMTQKMQAF